MKPSLLIVGCGNVARRALPSLIERYRVLATYRDPAQAAALRAAGAIPGYAGLVVKCEAVAVVSDLDQPATLTRLAGLASRLLYTAPPPAQGERDPRVAHLIAALKRRSMLPQHLVYISTTGVYGDCGGAWVDETRTPAPDSPRGKRRLDAERQWRRAAQSGGVSLSILRVPGIYAIDRLPVERVMSGSPVLQADEDNYGNHIHADDLAGLIVAALARYQGGIRVFNACDNFPLPTGTWLECVAAFAHLPPLPRLPRAALQQVVSPALWSFLRESRRVSNQRIRHELRYPLRYPDVGVFFTAHAPCRSCFGAPEGEGVGLGRV